MNDTIISQNGVSSSQLSGHMHHGSIQRTPGRRREPQGCDSSGLSNRSHQAVSDHHGKEGERIFQSRAVLLNLLQPPGNAMLRARRSSCTLPCQQTDKKTLLNSDLCVSHCLRCTDFQEAALNPVDIGSEVNDEWSQKRWHGNCINPGIKKQKQNISTHRDATKSHFQDRETVANLPCAGENLPRMSTNRANLPTIKAHCQGCEARARPFHSGKSQTLPDRCQHFPTDRQQYSKGHACFRKDTCTQDSKSVPYIAVKINTELQRKDEGSLKQMCPPTWRYKGCDSLMCQRPPSNQTLQRDHPDMGVAGDGKLTILKNNERLPGHLRRSVESGKDLAYQIERSAHQDPSSTTQDELEDHKTNSLSSYSMCSSQSYHREPFFPSGEMVSPAVRLVNGQEYRREERNLRLAKPSERDHQIVPHSPNELSPVIESPSDECTPVIVQCYSLSTVSSTLPPSLMSDSQFVNRREPASTVHSISGDPTFLASPSHSRYIHQQHSPRSLQSASPMQSNEPFVYDSPGPRSVPNPHSYNFAPQAKHTIDESSTTEIGVDDEEKQTRSATLPEQFQKRCAIPANCPCRNCQSGFHAFKNGYDGNYSQTHRRDHHPFNEQWTETNANTSRHSSQQSIVHPPNDYHMSRSSVDVRNDHESGDMFSNWQTRKVPGKSRPALNIHDYYEERRIVVGKVYQNVPRSVESSQFNQSSTIPFARTEQFHQQKPYQGSVTNAEVFQTHAGEQSTMKICNQQPEIAVGSKKRKSRQPRPQRVKPSDPALAREEHQHPIQHEENRHEDFTNSNYHHQASSPFRHRASASEETSRKRREDVSRSDVHAYGPDHESTNPVQHELATRRDDNVFDSNSTGPEVRRRAFPPENPSPRRTFVHEKITNKISPERSEQISEFQRSPRDVPPYQLVGKDNHGKHNSREYPVNSYYQMETPNKYFAYSNANGIPERNAEQQCSLGPTRIRNQENHFETSERIRNGCDSADASFSSRKFGSRSGSSQRNTLMPTEERVRVTSQFESTSESTWDVSATSIHGVHQGDSFYHDVVSAKGKSPQSDSESQLSLHSDSGCVSSTTVDDGVELQGNHGNERPFQSIEATATTNRRSRPLKEQVKSGLFLHTREAWANYMTPAIKERKFVCRYCSKKFAHFSTLQNHIRTHTGDKPFQCKFCSRRFAQSGVLKAHLRTHTGDKPFACMYCGKMFAQSTTLTNHLRTHTGHKPYVCQFCSKSFSQPSTLRKHELSHTKERPYPCKFCGKAFAQQSTLTNHLRSHTGQRPYKCHFCEKSFAQLSTLDRHLRLHSSASVKPYQCRHCSKSFSYFSNLASHMQNHEQEQK